VTYTPSAVPLDAGQLSEFVDGELRSISRSLALQDAFNPALNYGNGTVGLFLKRVYGTTAAETAAGITPTNYYYPPGHVYRYGTNTTPGTTDMTTALAASISQAKQSGGADAFWPAATLLVSTLTLDGSGYNIRTAGGRKTILKQTTGTDPSFGQIMIVTGSNINIGDLAFIGNIATDVAGGGEFHHCVYCYDDNNVKNARNITFGNLYGTDILGDVLYAGTNAAASGVCEGIRFGTVSGTNVYRNLVSCVGAEMIGEAIINDGPVGYRDFDVEPNAATTNPSDFRVNYIKAGCTQITSGNSSIANVVRIGTLDCKFGRIQATTPGYPSAPGTNGQALLVMYCQTLTIDYLKCRDYNYIPVFSTTASIKSQIQIGVADISNCCVTETTYKALFADQGSGGIGTLEIGNLIATLFSTSKMVFNGNGMRAIVRSGTVSGGLLATAIPNGIYQNLTLDVNSATGNILDTCTDSDLSSVSFTNAGSATLLKSCTGTMLERVSGTFGTVEGSGCADNSAYRCNINGVKYTGDLLNGYIMNKAMADANQTLSATESEGKILHCTGALTAQRNLVVNAVNRIYIVDNSTTGGFGIQAIGPSGVGVVIAGGKRATVYFDGTNMVRATADV
jgi:hypothetical protein